MEQKTETNELTSMNQTIAKLIKNDEIRLTLETECQRLSQLIQSGHALTSADTKEYRSAYKAVNDYVKSYKNQIKENITKYDTLVNQWLSTIGYREIEEVIQGIKDQNAKKRTERLDEKMDKVNTIITTMMDKHDNIKLLKVNTSCLNRILQLFPDLSSGAKDKDIKDWSIIETVVEKMYDTLNTKLATIDKSYIKLLPTYSDFYTKITEFFKLGDYDLIENITTLSKKDEQILKDIKIAEIIKDSEQCIKYIKQVLNSDINNDTKIDRIDYLIQLHKNNL